MNLERLPINANGKVDRQALPLPRRAHGEVGCRGAFFFVAFMPHSHAALCCPWKVPMVPETALQAQAFLWILSQLSFFSRRLPNPNLVFAQRQSLLPSSSVLLLDAGAAAELLRGSFGPRGLGGEENEKKGASSP